MTSIEFHCVGNENYGLLCAKAGKLLMARTARVFGDASDFPLAPKRTGFQGFGVVRLAARGTSR